MHVVSVTVETLVLSLLHNTFNYPHRYIVGIVGGPAAGKSTLATTLCASINEKAQQSVCVVVPMDGFHYPNVILRERNLSSIKGKPQTFDATTFINTLKSIRDNPNQSIWCTAYDRHLHDPVQNAIEVNAAHKIVIVEGNYLLLDSPPWNDIPPLLNTSYYVSTPPLVILKRLLKRHRKGGSSLPRAIRKILVTDIPNYFLIEETQSRADYRISIKN